MDEKKTAASRLRPFWLMAVAPLTAGLLLSLFLSRELGDLSGDSARYLLLAKALAQGQGYVELEKPGRPPHTEYAPGLPLCLTPIFFGAGNQASGRVAGNRILAAKLVPALALMLSVFFLSLLIRSAGVTATPLAAVLAALGLAAMPGLSRFANQVLSDLPYLAASLGGLCYLYHLLNRERPVKPGAWLLAGLLISAAFLFRQVGLALAAGAGLGIILQRDRPWRTRLLRAGLFAAGFLVPAGAWMLRNYLQAGAVDPGHFAKLFMAQDGNPLLAPISVSALAPRTLAGLSAYFRESAGLLLDLAGPLLPRPLHLFLAFAVTLPLLVGLVYRLYQKRGPLEWYFLFYLVLISAWQNHNPRYLIPLLPAAIIFAAAGIKIGFGSERWLPGVGGLLIVFNLGMLGADLYRIHRAPVTPVPGAAMSEDDRRLLGLTGAIHWGYWYQYPDWLKAEDPTGIALRYHRLLAMATLMGEQLPPSAVVAARKPPLVAWLSGRAVVQYPPFPEPDAFLSGLSREGVTYILMDEVSPGVRRLLEDVIAKRADLFQPELKLGATRVYTILYYLD